MASFTPRPLDEQLCFTLYATSIAVTRMYKPMLDRMGITYPQYLVLAALGERDGLTVGAIADRLALESSTVTPPIKRMEQAGLVERRRSKEDERQVNVFLTVETLNIPYALREKRLKIEAIGDDFYRVLVRFGFMEVPDVPLALMRSCDAGGTYFDPMDTTYFASRETVVASRHRGMPIWRDRLFAFMHRNAAPATGFFRIPGNRLVELGAQVEI